jgi:hypothetical protein
MQEEIDRSVTRARDRIAALGDIEVEARFGHHVDEPDRLLEWSTAQLLADITPSPLLVLAAVSG